MSEKLSGYPQQIPEEPGATIIGVRHADKDTGTETLNNQLQLSESGRENARIEAEAYYRYILAEVPPGAIVSLASSAMDRAIETRQIFIDTLLECIRQNKDKDSRIKIIKRYKRNGTERSKHELRKAMIDTNVRYLIVDEQEDEDLGYRRSEGDNIGPFNGAMEFFKNEHMVSMIWASRPGEFPALIEHIFHEMKASQGELTLEEEEQLLQSIIDAAEKYLSHSIRTPEELVANQLEAVERSVVRGFETHPDRRHVFHYIQHAPGLSFLALELFQKDGISFESYDSLGDYQHYLEAMSFDVDKDGNVIFIDFRQNRSSIEPVKLGDIIANLYKKSEIRKAEWSQYFGRNAMAA